MALRDCFIIAVVAALFVIAIIVYRKKPRCACGKDSGCNGNCAGCSCKCGIFADK